MRTYLSFALASLVACGGGGKATIDGPGTGIDAPKVDAPMVDVVLGPTINISGVAETVAAGSMTAAKGVTVGAYLEGATTPLVTTTTAADGSYTFAVPSVNGQVTGYIKGSLATYDDTYLYAPGPITTDQTMANIKLIKQGTIDALYELNGITEDPAKATVGLEVVDATQAVVAGAVVTATPAPSNILYTVGGLPSKSGTMTGADGLAYLANTPTGTVSVGATKTGSTFTSHNIIVRANALTTTLIAP
jgi:hypothetical protein